MSDKQRQPYFLRINLKRGNDNYQSEHAGQAFENIYERACDVIVSATFGSIARGTSQSHTLKRWPLSPSAPSGVDRIVERLDDMADQLQRNANKFDEELTEIKNRLY